MVFTSCRVSLQYLHSLQFEKGVLPQKAQDLLKAHKKNDKQTVSEKATTNIVKFVSSFSARMCNVVLVVEVLIVSSRLCSLRANNKKLWQ